MKMKKAIGLALAALLCVCFAAGCAQEAPTKDIPAAGGNSAAPQGNSVPQNQGEKNGEKICFFDQMADDAIAALHLSGTEDDDAKIKAAFRYVIAATYFTDYTKPEFTDLWRYLDACGAAPSLYQVMATGPLLFGIGTCEHYAAALVVILQRMGYEALYVPGLTYSVSGQLVEHAWAMVKVGEGWYHIDPQLEDNVIKAGRIRYKYFLKGDEEFAAHHVWGTRRKEPDAYSKSLPACAASRPQQEAEEITQDPAPTAESLAQRAAALKSAANLPRCDAEPTGVLPV